MSLTFEILDFHMTTSTQDLHMWGSFLTSTLQPSMLLPIAPLPTAFSWHFLHPHWKPAFPAGILQGQQVLPQGDRKWDWLHGSPLQSTDLPISAQSPLPHHSSSTEICCSARPLDHCCSLSNPRVGSRCSPLPHSLLVFSLYLAPASQNTLRTLL